MKRQIFSALFFLATVLLFVTLLSSCAGEKTDVYGTYIGRLAIIKINRDNTFTMESLNKPVSEDGEEVTPEEDKYALSGTVEFNSKTNVGYFFKKEGKDNAPVFFSISDSGNMVVVFDDTSRSVSGTYVSYRISGKTTYNNMFYGSEHTELFEKQ